MGFCARCGNQTEGKDPLCNQCKTAILSQNRRYQKENGIDPNYTNTNYDQQGYNPNMNQMGYDPNMNPNMNQMGYDPNMNPNMNQMGYDPNMNPNMNQMGYDPNMNPNMNQMGYDPNMNPNMNQMGYDPNMNIGPKPKYWASIFDDPTKAYQRICDNMPPMNPDININKNRQKFNIGAFFCGGLWVAFNVNFVLGIIYGVAISAISWGLNTMHLGCISEIALFALNVFVAQNANEITWKTRPYKNLEHFEKIQKIWAFAGIAIFVTTLIVIFAIAFIIAHESIK